MFKTHSDRNRMIAAGFILVIEIHFMDVWRDMIVRHFRELLHPE